MATVKPNANVSNALLKALSTRGSKQPSPIAPSEWVAIKKAAVAEVKKSERPNATLKAVKASLAMADRISEKKYSQKFGELAGTLESLVDKKAVAQRSYDRRPILSGC